MNEKKAFQTIEAIVDVVTDVFKPKSAAKLRIPLLIYTKLLANAEDQYYWDKFRIYGAWHQTDMFWYLTPQMRSELLALGYILKPLSYDPEKFQILREED